MSNAISDLEIESYKQYLNSISSAKPLAKLFRTEMNAYIYDTGTSKIMQCEKLEYQLLEGILNNKTEECIDDLVKTCSEQRTLQALENIKGAVEHEHILKSIKPEKFYSPAHFETLEHGVNNQLGMVVLELTESCNLRCGYCIFGSQFDQKRNHGDTNMTEEIARAAIDYLEKHSKEDEIAITFYGGEPLLRFDLLKYSIDYAQRTISRPNLYFSLTTNLTLVTEEIAVYLASVKNLSLVCSIDGPQEIHDSYRKDIKGNGSFDRAIRGLKYLVEAFGDSAGDKISLSMVFTPPYSVEKLEQINRFFKQLNWLPLNMNKSITYPSANSIIDQTWESKNVTNNSDMVETTLSDWSKQQFLNQLNDEDVYYFTKKNIDDWLVKIHKRNIFTEPVEEYPLNGCCIPASRRLYVTAKGDFHLCERVAGAPSIGNVITGVDFQKLKSVFIDAYAAASIKYCSDCWAIRVCGMCYTESFSDGRLDMNSKNLHCFLLRSSLEDSLINYHEYMERAPEKLLFLNDIVIR